MAFKKIYLTWRTDYWVIFRGQDKEEILSNQFSLLLIELKILIAPGDSKIYRMYLNNVVTVIGYVYNAREWVGSL